MDHAAIRRLFRGVNIHDLKQPDLASLHACINCIAGEPMRKTEKQPSVFVVYPAALLDGWEVVKEHDDKPVSFDSREEATAYARAQAVKDGGAVIKLEDWYGNLESVWEAQPQTGRQLALTTS